MNSQITDVRVMKIPM